MKRTFTGPKSRYENESGVSLMEVLFALVLFSIVGLGLAHSMMTSLRTRGRNVASAVATQIALETVEDFTAIDPNLLDDTYDETDFAISRNNLSFLRTVDVSIEADRTRTIEVNVRNEAFNIRTELSNSFSLWGKR